MRVEPAITSGPTHGRDRDLGGGRERRSRVAGDRDAARADAARLLERGERERRAPARGERDHRVAGQELALGELAARRARVVLGALDGAAQCGVPARDDPAHAVARVAEGRRDLGGVEDADAPARPRADVEPAPAALQAEHEDRDRLARSRAAPAPTAAAARWSSRWIVSRISRVLRRSRSLVASRTSSVRTSSSISVSPSAGRGRRRMVSVAGPGLETSPLLYHHAVPGRRGRRSRGSTGPTWSRASKPAPARPAAARAPPGPLFEAEPAGMRERLAETSEARALLDLGSDAAARTASATSTGRSCGSRRAARSRRRELLEVASTLGALRATARFLAAAAEAAPRLAALGERDRRPRPRLESAITRVARAGRRRCATPPRPSLAAARREARELAAETQARIERSLRDPTIAPALSDSFFTLRGDRYVLPVRSDARARVPGIVHDASASGTTLFIEPQALVELNNRLKQAELAIRRETRARAARALRATSRTIARRARRAGSTRSTRIDFAFARGRALARARRASRPTCARRA